MMIRDIKGNDVDLGLKVVHKIQYEEERCWKDHIREVIHIGGGMVRYDNGGHDPTYHLMRDYYAVEDKPTGIPTFDGDISKQVGGDHYSKNDPIQFAKDNYPLEHLEGFYRINVDKYMARYDKKNGIEDIKKAKHYIEMLLELKLKNN